MKNIPVILFGDHIAAYGVVRALGPLGMPIYVVSAKGNGITTKSRYVKGVLSLAADEDGFFPRLQKWGLEKIGDDAVLIVAGPDDYLDVLSRQYDFLPSGWRPTFPSWSIVRNVRQKRFTYDIAKNIGLSIPKSIYIEKLDDFNKFISSDIDFRWPLLLKPERSADFLKEYRAKGFICQSLMELKTFYSKYGVFEGGFIIQEFIPGPESSLINFIGIYNREAEPIRVFINRKRRSSGPLLSCTLMETDWSDAVIKDSNNLIKAIGYYGYANVEFKIDTRDNSLNLMEINGRVSMSNSHALLCGINLPFAMYLESIGVHSKPIVNFQCLYRKNILWWFPVADFTAIIKLEKKDFSLIAYLKSLRGHKRIAEPFNFRDPFPGLINVLFLINGIFRKCFQLMLGMLSLINHSQIKRIF